MKINYHNTFAAMVFPFMETAADFDMRTAQETFRGRYNKDDRILVLCDDNKWHPAKVVSIRGTKLKIYYTKDKVTETVDGREVEITHDTKKHGNVAPAVKGLKEGDKIEFRLEGLKVQGIVAGFIERDKAVYASVYIPAFGKNYPLNMKNTFKIIR